jgi:flagellar biosynthesis chaperone FliJ
MDIVDSDQLLLLAAGTTAITLLLGVLVIAVRIRKVRQQLLELDALKRSVQTVESNLAEIAQTIDRLSDGLPALSSLGLHFRQINRDQFCLSEKLRTISSAMDTLRELLQLREPIKREWDEELKEVADASRALQEWKSRITAVYADAGHLFESEPIRELIDHVGPQPAAGEPPVESERRTKPRSHKRVRPRRKR